MPRPKLPSDAIRFAKEMVDEGILSGSVRHPDGMEVSWCKSDVSSAKVKTPLKAWQAKRDASS